MLYVPSALFGVQFEAYQCDKPLPTRTLRLDTYLLRDAFDCYTFKYPTNDNLIFRSITYYRLKLSQFKIF